MMHLSTVALAGFFLAAGCRRPSPEGGKEIGTAADTADGRPIITALAAEYNFGQVKQGAEVEHIFKIKNTGDKNLVIERTSGS